MRKALESYEQTCKYGPCWMCADKGKIKGNGSALTSAGSRQGNYRVMLDLGGMICGLRVA